jgi:pimeloyl-ACP methyl ester carboxylesterase
VLEDSFYGKESMKFSLFKKKPLQAAISPDTGVDVLEAVEIGQMQQWILARGQDAALPLLLWLHGGPGDAQMPIARRYDSCIEREFIVVHWDQRGAGKSNPPGFDESTMTFPRYRQDVLEMTRYLKQRFRKGKLFLLGHSWGTEIGLDAASLRPEEYYAYIGVSQVVSLPASEVIAHGWLRLQMEAFCDAEGLKRLEALGTPPYEGHEAFANLVRMLESYGADLDAGKAELLLAALQSPDYHLADYVQWLGGSERAGVDMWGGMFSFDAPSQYPRLEVPAYFITGRKDYVTPLELVQAYVDMLVSPKGKSLTVFENSAHTPFIGETEKFSEELFRIKRETL